MTRAGDRPDSVMARVRRDREMSNVLFVLLGLDDERDPDEAREMYAAKARAILDRDGPAYRQRVIRACAQLAGLVLDAAEQSVAAFTTLTPAQQAAALRLADLPRCQNASHSGFGARLCDDCEAAGPHPFSQRLDQPPNEGCSVCGQPSGAVEHFTPTGLLNMPGIVAVDPAPAVVHPVTGHPLHPIRETGPGCPTCGHTSGHADTCAEQDH